MLPLRPQRLQRHGNTEVPQTQTSTEIQKGHFICKNVKTCCRTIKPSNAKPCSRRGKTTKNTSSKDKTMTKEARSENFPGCARMSPKTRTNNPEIIVLPWQHRPFALKNTPAIARVVSCVRFVFCSDPLEQRV